MFFFKLFYKNMLLCFFILCVFLFKKIQYTVLTWPKEPQANAYLHLFSTDSEQTNKIMCLRPTTVFVLFISVYGYLGNTGNLRYVAQSISTFKKMLFFFKFLNVGYKTCFFKIFFIFTSMFLANRLSIQTVGYMA